MLVVSACARPGVGSRGCLRRARSSTGQRAGSFTLQSVVLEYVTSRLVTTACEEIGQGGCSGSVSHALSAGPRDYVRQDAGAAAVAPLLRAPLPGRAEVEGSCARCWDGCRNGAEKAQGYWPANCGAAAAAARGSAWLDLSQLSAARRVSARRRAARRTLPALMRESVFTETFDAIWAVAITAAGSTGPLAASGEVRVWCEAGQTLQMSGRPIRTWYGLSPSARTNAACQREP